jgi:hypothetical protein
LKHAHLSQGFGDFITDSVQLFFEIVNLRHTITPVSNSTTHNALEKLFRFVGETHKLNQVRLAKYFSYVIISSANRANAV